MNHRAVPRPPPPPTVRVVVEDVPDLDERVSEAACRARDLGLAVELVQRSAVEGDHDAQACLIRCMDEALAVARRAAPGVDVRVGLPVELPRPRTAP